jgi:predicted aspartyl protease
MSYRLPTSLLLAPALALLGALARPEPAAGVLDVPMAMDGPYPVVTVALPGQDSLRFVVDAAAGASVVSPRYAAIAPDGPTTRVQGAAGSAAMRVVALDSLRLAGRVFAVRAVVQDLAPFGVLSSRPIDGVLGQDVLARFDVEFDLPGGRLRLHPRAESAGAGAASGPRAPVASVVSARRAEVAWGAGMRCLPLRQAPGAFVVVDVQVGDSVVPGIWDTGAANTYLNWPAARTQGLRAEGDPRVRVAGSASGLEGQRVPRHAAKGVTLAVAGAPLAEGEVRLSDLPVFRPFGLDARPAVLLGVDRIRDRPWLLSYSTRELCVGG